MALKYICLALFAVFVALVQGATRTSPPTPGWGPPPHPPPHPPSSANITLSGDIHANGGGAAIESHSENIHVEGGWGVPADLTVATGGETGLGQDGSMIQSSNLDSGVASSVQALSVGQSGYADESLAVTAEGLSITVGHQGSATVVGEGNATANGQSHINS